jgi:acyl-ACP thioesterase
MTKPFTRTFTATPKEIDELGHVNNAVWVRWIQDMATSHWQAVADPAHIAAYFWVVTRHEIDYRGNIAAGESVTGRTWIESQPKGAQFDRRDDRQGERATGPCSARNCCAIYVINPLSLRGEERDLRTCLLVAAERGLTVRY